MHYQQNQHKLVINSCIYFKLGKNSFVDNVKMTVTLF